MLNRFRRLRRKLRRRRIHTAHIFSTLFIVLICLAIGWMGFNLLIQFGAADSFLVQTILHWGMPNIGGEQEGYPGFEYTLRSILYMLTDYELGNPKSFLTSSFPILSQVKQLDVSQERAYIYVPELEYTPEPTPPRPAPELRETDEPTRVVERERPQVLIYHTHTSEMYLGPELAQESLRDAHYVFRSANDDMLTGVMEVGRHLGRALKERGISALHETKIHDFPSLALSYTNSRQTVTNLLNEYPSIEIVLDVHRDADVPDPVVEIDGEQVARVLLVLGTAEDVPMSHPNWRENMEFANRFTTIADNQFPGLMRPMQVRGDARYNQHLHPQSVVIEIGSVENTLPEALRAADLVADIIAQLL